MHDLLNQTLLVVPPESRILVVVHRGESALPIAGRCVVSIVRDDVLEVIASSQARDYLLVPRASFPWLTASAELQRLLESVSVRVQHDDACAIYSLRPPRLSPSLLRANPRVVAIVATHNEERLIGRCIETLLQEGADVFLIDNDSGDATVDIAKTWLGRGLLGWERLPRQGSFCLEHQLRRKEELAQTLDYDWFMHVDADEVRSSPVGDMTLVEAFAAVDALGYNAVNFQEYTFIPTQEQPDHYHNDYMATMRWYYPFLPSSPWRVNAWRKQLMRVDLASSGGHQLYFPGIRLFPRSFPMKHYQFLSLAHAARKYGRAYADKELSAGLHGGWQGWRSQIRASRIRLPSQTELRELRCDQNLDATRPRATHVLDDVIASSRARPPAMVSTAPALPKLAIVACLRDEAEMVGAYLAYHHALGAERAYLYLDECTDETAAIIDQFPWAIALAAPEIEGPHRLERLQCACTTDALARAQAEGYTWLLHIDADEFAWGGPLAFEGSAVRAGNLLAMLERANDTAESVVLQTYESVPTRKPQGARFWEYQLFTSGTPIRREVLDPSTGEKVLLARPLGHYLGKSAIRAGDDFESATPHRWTRRQGRIRLGAGCHQLL